MSIQPSFPRWREALARGAPIVVPSGRLGAVLRASFDRDQAARGLAVWPAPSLYSWQEWVTLAVAEQPGALGSAEVMLSPAQEQALWVRCITESATELALPAVAPGALARLAQRAWATQHGYRVPIPALAHRGSLEQHAFRVWSLRFQALCETLAVVDQSRVLPRLAPRQGTAGYCVGFDDASPAVLRLLPPASACPAAVRAGNWQYAQFAALDEEIAAAVSWAIAGRRTGDTDVPVLVCADPALEGPLERALSRALTLGRGLLSGFGTTAPGYRAIRTAEPSMLVATALQILQATIELSRVTAASLITSPYLGEGIYTQSARVRVATALLEGGVEPVGPVTLSSLCRAKRYEGLTDLWSALQLLGAEQGRRLDLKQWLARFERILGAAGWPGAVALTMSEDDDLKRWRRALDEVSTLDLVLPAQTFAQALQWLTQAAMRSAAGTTPALDAIEILSLSEAVALGPAHVWVLGLHAGAWPKLEETSPFLPYAAQREAGVPAALRDEAFTVAATRFSALSTYARSLQASFAVHAGDVEQQAVQGLALGAPRLRADPAPAALPRVASPLEAVTDEPVPVTAQETIRGGTSLLLDQSACPFRAFARHRLRAKAAEYPELGPDPRQRGQSVHQVLAVFWRQFRTQAAVKALSDTARAAALRAAVREVLAANEMPPAGWTLEHARLERVCGAWLVFDLTRPDFEVVACETPYRLQLDGLTLELQIDRVDRLANGTMLLIDYKTGGKPARGQWDLPRPAQPQLLAYALAEPLAGGIAFACVRSDRSELIDFPRDIGLGQDVSASAAFIAAREAWADELTRLGHQFLAGDAAVAPKDRGKTCQYCDLQVLCRVHERSDEGAEDERDG